jgi:hypothetical protein
MMWSVSSILIRLVKPESSLSVIAADRRHSRCGGRDNITQPKVARVDTCHTGMRR